jgi:hypothetical protein
VVSAPTGCHDALKQLRDDVERGEVGRDHWAPALFTLTRRDPNRPERGMEVVAHSGSSDSATARKRIELYTHILTSLFNQSSLPTQSMSFLVNTQDGCCHKFKSHGVHLPFLSQCRDKALPNHCEYVTLVPSYSTNELTMNFQKNRAKKLGVTVPTKWGEKIDKVIWRGSPTGQGPVIQRDRVQHLIPFASHPDMDVCFSQFHSFHENLTEVTEYLSKYGLHCPEKKIEFFEFGKYRYILDMDGNSWSDRFIHLLSLGSTIFKQTSDFEDIATLKTRPFVHYIPIKKNLSNLEAAVRHCRSNPVYCQKVAENGVRFIEEEFTHQKRLAIWASQLMENHKLCELLGNGTQKTHRHSHHKLKCPTCNVLTPYLSFINVSFFLIAIIIVYLFLCSKRRQERERPAWKRVTEHSS